MDMNNDRMWAISLFVIGIATIIIAGANIVGIDIPDPVHLTLAIIELIALPVLVYTTVKKTKKK